MQIAGAATAGPVETDAATTSYLTAMRPLLFHQCNMHHESHSFNSVIAQSLSQPVPKERL